MENGQKNRWEIQSERELEAARAKDKQRGIDMQKAHDSLGGKGSGINGEQPTIANHGADTLRRLLEIYGAGAPQRTVEPTITMSNGRKQSRRKAGKRG